MCILFDTFADKLADTPYSIVNYPLSSNYETETLLPSRE